MDFHNTLHTQTRSPSDAESTHEAMAAKSTSFFPEDNFVQSVSMIQVYSVLEIYLELVKKYLGHLI